MVDSWELGGGHFVLKTVCQLPQKNHAGKWGGMTMRAIKIYESLDGAVPMREFLASLDKKLRRKLLMQIVRLSQVPLCELKEPHFKHFVLEKYSQLYELREKNKVLVRVIFTIQDGDIILLAPFFKRQPRDTMRALEQSLGILADIRDHPECAVNIEVLKEEAT